MKLDHCPACGCVLEGVVLIAPDRPGERVAVPLDDAVEQEEVRVPRSLDQHRAFFRMITLAVKQWPESHEELLEGVTLHDRVEHARAWLTCQAGWRTRYGAPWGAETFATAEKQIAYGRAIVAATRLHGYAWPAVDGHGRIHIVHAKSIAHDVCTHEQFRPIFDYVKGYIEHMLNIIIEFNPAERAALKKMGVTV